MINSLILVLLVMYTVCMQVRRTLTLINPRAQRILIGNLNNDDGDAKDNAIIQMYSVCLSVSKLA